jgi:hypothetical protein
MKELIKAILLILSLISMFSIFDSMEIAYAVPLLNMSNTNSILNNNTSSTLNNMSQNSTAPNASDSIPDDDESGSISSLPGKCLGSALCPD